MNCVIFNEILLRRDLNSLVRGIDLKMKIAVCSLLSFIQLFLFSFVSSLFGEDVTIADGRNNRNWNLGHHRVQKSGSGLPRNN